MEALLIKKYCVKRKHLILIVLGVFLLTPLKAQIIASGDCVTANRICDVTQSYYFESQGPGTIDDSFGANQLYCLNQGGFTQWENLAAWFTFTPQYSGEFGFIVCPEIQTDEYNYALFTNNPVCGNLTNNTYWLDCNPQPPLAVSEGCTGLGFKNGFGGGGSSGLGPYFTIQAGTTYVLYVEADILPITTPRRATLSFQGAVVTAHPDLFNHPSCTFNTSEFALKTKVKVFPNPFSNSLQIESEVPLQKMALFDVLGKEIFNQNFVNQIDTSNLPRGVYFLKLYTFEGESVVKKVVKE